MAHGGLEFRLLGPLEVRNGDAVVPVGGVKQRLLLALLLVNANEVVLRDRLIDELWGDRSLENAGHRLEMQVSRLRKMLGVSEVLVARPGGYAIEVDPLRIDAHRFEQLVQDGRSANAAGMSADAAAALRQALRLWRGGALADLAYQPFARLEAERLDELRVAAVEERVEADLALGKHHALVAELEALTARHPVRERPHGQLMLALYRAGRQSDALAVYQRARRVLVQELGIEPSRRLRDLEQAILQQDRSLELARPDADQHVVCPFKGLAFFDRSDAGYFCGRERVVSDLVARLSESTLVGILGPSGIGKSSLLRAGVLPTLSAGALPGSDGWRQVLLRPGEHPCAELASAVGDGGLEAACARLGGSERIVVAVDQLEELFSVCEREAERSAFLEQLAAAACDQQRRALVVVSSRGDFYDRFASYPRFAELLSGSHVLVGPMDREDLARAIEQPSSRAGLDVDRPLVDALVSEVTGETGGLPLLSATLLELWRDRDGRTLQYESYRRSGGVRGAVARLAETTYAQLGEREQRVARSVLLRLASGEDGMLTRRRVPIAELDRIADARQVIGALTDARLVTVSDGEVELSHEALLREWPRYGTWLEEDRAGRRLHAHLAVSAREWHAAGRDPGELYRGARLASTLEWAAGRGDQLSALEREFIQSSRSEAERHDRRLRSLLVGVGVLLLVAVGAGIVAVIKQHAASNEARVALARELGAEAVNEPRLDLAMLLARESVNLDPSPQTEATLLATLQRNPRGIGTLRSPASWAAQLALSPNGRTLEVSHFNAYANVWGASVAGVRFYNPRTRAVTHESLPDFGGAQPPAFSSDGSLVAYPTPGEPTRGVPPSIAVRNVDTLALLSTLTFEPSQLVRLTPDAAHASVLIAPDRRTVYCAYRVFDLLHDAPRGLAEPYPGATYLQRWSLPSGHRLSMTRIDPGAVLAVRLIDSGTRLVVVDARSVSVWDASSLHRVSSVAITPTAPTAPTVAAIGPDGRTVAIGAPTGQVSFIDASTGRARPGTGARSTPVTAVTYSPDGRAVASAGTDSKVIVWRPRTATAAEVLTAPAGQVQGIAFTPDATALYASSVGGALLEWDLTGDRSFGLHRALGDAAACCASVSPLAPPLALSPDGTTFAVRLGRSTVGLFSARTLRRRGSFTLGPRGGVITGLAWSPTEPELAVGGRSGLVQLWRVDGAPRLMRSLTGLQPLIPGVPEAIQALTFSHDGRLLAASDSSGTTESPGAGVISLYGNRLASLAIWRASTGRLVARRDLGTGPGRYGALAISRDDRLLAASLPNGSDVIQDLTTGRVRHTLRPLGGDATVSLAFARNGLLATGTLSGIVQLWNPVRGDQAAGPIAVGAGPVASIAFDPSGRRFATTGDDGAVKLWFTSTLEPEGAAFNIDEGAAATAAFEPGGTRLLVIDNHGNGFAWPMSTGSWERRACAIAGRSLTRQEWSRYLGGRPYTPVCSGASRQ